MSSVTEQTLVHAVVRKIHTPSNGLLAKKGLTSNMLGQGTGTEIMAAILLGHAQSGLQWLVVTNEQLILNLLTRLSVKSRTGMR